VTGRDVDALLDLVNEKNRIITILEQQMIEHGIEPSIPAPTLEVEQ
jgi:hypothetical protein